MLPDLKPYWVSLAKGQNMAYVFGCRLDGRGRGDKCYWSLSPLLLPALESEVAFLDDLARTLPVHYCMQGGSEHLFTCSLLERCDCFGFCVFNH